MEERSVPHKEAVEAAGQALKAMGLCGSGEQMWAMTYSLAMFIHERDSKSWEAGYQRGKEAVSRKLDDLISILTFHGEAERERFAKAIAIVTKILHR